MLTLHVTDCTPHVTSPSPSPSPLSRLSPQLLSLKPEFDAFLARFEKKYAYGTPNEYARRLGIFARNVALAAARQADDRGSAVHGVTRFSDLTPEEFASEFLGTPITGAQIARRKAHKSATHLETLPTAALPESFDWREKGAAMERFPLSPPAPRSATHGMPASATAATVSLTSNPKP